MTAVRVATEASAAPAPRAAPRHARALGMVFVFGLLYVARHLDRGWVPFDEGTLAQAADRVMRGQLPHRDFDDVYTGGLALWDALAFHTFGVALLSLRLALLAVFAAWIPAVYYVASRVAPPVRAAFVTFLAIAWSVPNYNAAMPSWYNLFLATFAIAAIVRHAETANRRWLVVAGVAAGLSILVKVVGLYLVAGIFLYLIHEEQLAALATRDEARSIAPSRRTYSVVITLGLSLFVVALALLVRRDLGASEVVQFVLPGAALAAFLVHREWTTPALPDGPRWRRLLGHALPFLAGVALPVAIFLFPYLRTGSVGALLNGVFVLPMRRFEIVTRKLPPLWTILAAVPLPLLAWGARRVRRPLRWYESAALWAAAVTFVYLTGRSGPLYRGVWHSARWLLPLLVLVGIAVLSRPREADREQPALSRITFLVLACAALCSLVQFPFPAPVYFAYAAPLVILAALVLFRYAGPVTPALPRAVLAVYLLFAMFRLNIAALTRMGVDYLPFFGTRALTIERGGLQVSRREEAMYDGIIPALRRHARGGETWAAPDLPEIYFLSGLHNPTRAISEALTTETIGDSALVAMLDAHGITAIVLNLNTYYSRPPSPLLQGLLQQRYPNAEEYGPLQLRWRE